MMQLGTDNFDRLEPDTLLPSQFESGPDETPQQRLFRGMLEDAIVRLRHNNPAGQEALRWFESRRDEWGSFLFVCEEIGIDHGGALRYAREIWTKRTTYRRIHRVTVTRTRIGSRD